MAFVSLSKTPQICGVQHWQWSKQMKSILAVSMMALFVGAGFFVQVDPGKSPIVTDKAKKQEVFKEMPERPTPTPRGKETGG
jgi:hypothetical protein